MKYKLVTYKNLKIGQEICGTEGPGSFQSFNAYVKSINLVHVTVEMWKKGGDEKKIDSNRMFRVQLSKDEFNAKYQEKAKEVLKNIQNKLYRDQIGYHEMWNSWLYAGTPYDIAEYCTDQNIKIVGYSSDIVPKIAMFSKDTLDVGVCAEYEDGERFWCHYRYSDIQDMLEEYKELL